MSEVTRVPLQPIEKGSVLKIWLGVIALLVIGIGAAWAMVPRGVAIETLAAGSGASPAKTDIAQVNYVGKFANGEEFGRQDGVWIPADAELGVIKGMADSLQKMQKGGKYRVEIPSAFGYGSKPFPEEGKAMIPANSDLVFEVEMLDYMPMQQFQIRQQMQMQQMQQMQQQMQGGAGGPGGAPELPTSPGPAGPGE